MPNNVLYEDNSLSYAEAFSWKLLILTVRWKLKITLIRQYTHFCLSAASSNWYTQSNDFTHGFPPTFSLLAALCQFSRHLLSRGKVYRPKDKEEILQA